MNSSYLESSGRQSVNRQDKTPFRFSTRRDSRVDTARTAAPAATPTPPKTRPRGRLLIAMLMLLACSTGLFTVWDSLLRYRAYGVVTGRIIDVGVPMDGILTSVNVSEGDFVRQETRLAKVVDLDVQQQLERITDELRVADATLHAEIARIQWQSHVEETEMTKSVAELFEWTGKLHDGSGELELLRYQLDFNRSLIAKNASTQVDLDSVEIRERAKEEELDSVRQALEVLKERARKAVESPRLGTEQVQPLIAKSEMLQNEIARLREKISQGELRSPVNGRILQRHHPAGECIKSHDTLFSVIEESSLEVELFLPQDMSAKYKVGDTVRLKIDPWEELVPCRVTSIGAEHRRPPEHIEIFYRSNVRLLPVRVKPLGPLADENKLSVGAIAKLPHVESIL